MLRFPIPDKARKFKGVLIGPGSGPAERIVFLQQMVTKLFRHERIEGREDKMHETRQYAEQLINVAMIHGDQHQPTMDMAKQWLLERDLVHKLFKVYVPRYIEYSTSYTRIYRLPATYPGTGRFNAVLEFKGNPYPSIIPHQRKTDGLISNVLIHAAYKKIDMERLAEKNKSGVQDSDKVKKEIKTEKTSVT